MNSKDPDQKSPEFDIPRPTRLSHQTLIVISILFWGMAVAFLLLPTSDPIPAAKAVTVSAADIDTSPRFELMDDNAVAMVSAFHRQCMDCHDSLVDNDKPRSDVNRYHDTIEMNHGVNTRCVNCHDQTDRNKLVLRDGKTLGYSQSTQLCAGCHGPSYRQWQRGVHGKTLGFWDAKQGTPQKLQCAECHNPHSPDFAPMAPLPAPNTLRMGHQDPAGYGHGNAETSPLMRGKMHHPKNLHQSDK